MGLRHQWHQHPKHATREHSSKLKTQRAQLMHSYTKMRHSMHGPLHVDSLVFSRDATHTAHERQGEMHAATANTRSNN